MAENVSSSPLGPCRLVARVLTLSNSHAGTHADTPRHFHVNDGELDFPADCYTGACHVVDLSPFLCAAGSGPRAITTEILRAAAERGRFQWKDVWRALFITRDYDAEKKRSPIGTLDEWDDNFAHFDPKAADYLAAEASQLLLVGLDTPSMDHPTQSPICHGAHGALYRHKIALLENLNLDGVQLLIRASAAAASAATNLSPAHVVGTMMTVFIPAQSFPDAKGCAVVFFPSAYPSTVDE